MRHATPLTARFWSYVLGGWVRLALRDGETLTHSTGGPCDEGCHYETYSWSRDGETISFSSQQWGRDCDGGYERSHEATCAIWDLAARDSFEDTHGTPQWEKVDSRQRYYAAEAAGY